MSKIYLIVERSGSLYYDAGTNLSDDHSSPQARLKAYLEGDTAKHFAPLSYGFERPDFSKSDTLKNYHAEAVAAGRVIEKANGTYVARDPSAGGLQAATPFRIGGIYRQRDGRLVRLDAPSEAELHGNRSELHRYVGGPAVARNVATGGDIGWRDLASGRFPGHNELSEYNLLPGELDAQGNPIFAVQGTVTARLPAPAVVATPPEKKRAPLTWNQPKKVDRFDGFVVTSGCQDQDCHPQGHVLQRFADPDRAVLKL